MICATCQSATDAVACTHCGYDPRLGRAYALERPLLGAPNTPTYLARGPTEQPLVAEQVAQAAHVEYAVWEAAGERLDALRRCGHPAFARVIDVIESGAGDLRSIWLLREYLPPPSILVEARERAFTQPEILDLLTHLLDGLARLHGVYGVAHGKIEPGSLFRRPDGSVALTGFVVGETFDTAPDDGPSAPSLWRAPERAEGPPSPMADVYGVGMLAIYLLAGSRVPTRHDARGRLDWHPPEGVGPDLVAFLLALTDHDPRGRPRDGGAALEKLGHLHRPASTRASLLPPPPSQLVDAAPVEPPPAPTGWQPDTPLPRPSGFGPAVVPMAIGASFTLVLALLGSASAALEGGGSAARSPEDAAAVSEQAELVSRIATSYQLRRCVDQWRKAHPDAPEEEPRLTVTVLSTGSLVPTTSRGADHDLLVDLPGCTRDALGGVDGPERPIAVGGRRLFQLSFSLGARWSETVSYTYRWQPA